jgi:hypothetical protein
LQATLTANPGDANIAKTQVAMPKSLLLDNSHIGDICTKVQFASESCPPGSIYGTATAETPLLDQPLSGPVYLRSSDNKLPDLVADLEGQFEVELAGRIDTPKGGGLRTTFASVPDTPVTKFVLSLQGGKRGLLINSTNLCKGKHKAKVQMDGQNGASFTTRRKLQTACGGNASKKRKRGSTGGGR